MRRRLDLPLGMLGVRSPSPERDHRRYWPSSDLAPFVEHYWIVRWDLGAPATAETLPHPAVHMVFRAGRAELVGVMRGRFTTRLEGRGGVIGAKFRPGGFRPFVERPIAAFADRRWPLADVLGERVDALAEQVFACFDRDRDAIAHIESFLRTYRPATDAAMELAARTVARIAGDRTIRRVERLLDDAGTTRRGLQRLFREYVGATPKWVIQRYRLIEAAARLAAGDAADGAALAFDLGYADQAHFIRDFKRIVGQPPAAYARALKANAAPSR
ncbi:MAG TPA: helix-turn-helix domain-containing protein [Thermoanaerobaculia bacterium]|nr:helix-turn-helix domain-containing protein [Thermoanaerobaculia bacterium]